MQFKLRPNKKAALCTLLMTAATAASGVEAMAAKKNQALGQADCVKQEAQLVAECSITCATTCGLTNKC